MTFRRVTKTFTDRYPLIGPTIWMLNIQYFLVQLIVARVWAHPYSIARNTISDLGNTVCGPYSGHLVCSPQHNLMNASFILLGITMALGSMLIRQEFKKTSLSFVGFSFLALGGIGAILVGFFPENTISSLHVLGAGMTFLLGNLALLILSFGLRLPKLLRFYTFLSSCVALLALSLFYTHHYLGLGIGGMERITAYPQTVWLIVFGIYISRNHVLKRAQH